MSYILCSKQILMLLTIFPIIVSITILSEAIIFNWFPRMAVLCFIILVNHSVSKLPTL